jgi:hypothetical protein
MIIATEREQIERAEQLLRVIEQRKSLEQQETELKEYFKHLMGDDLVLSAGSVIMIRSLKSRTDLDRALLERQFSPEFIKGFEITKTYYQLQVVSSLGKQVDYTSRAIDKQVQDGIEKQKRHDDNKEQV